MDQSAVSIRMRDSSEASQLIDRLKQELERLHTGIESMHTTVHLTQREQEIVCQYEARELSEDGLKRFHHLLAQTMAEWIVTYKETGLLHHIIRTEYEDYDHLGFKQVEEYCRQILLETRDQANGASERSKHKMVDLIEECLHEHGKLHIEGFIRFRLQAYLDELKDIVEYAMDELIMDRQYQEFIALLKYFVFVQEAKLPAVHLIHLGDYEFILLDEALKPLETKQMEGVILETLEQDLNYEDVVVSTLITVSPKKLYIHSAHPELQVIRTIMQIFEERYELCDDSCTVCSALLNEHTAHKHKSTKLFVGSKKE